MIIDEQLIRDLSRWLSYKDGESLLFPSPFFTREHFLNYHGDFLIVILSGSEGSSAFTRLLAIAQSDLRPRTSRLHRVLRSRILGSGHFADPPGGFDSRCDLPEADRMPDSGFGYCQRLYCPGRQISDAAELAP